MKGENYRQRRLEASQPTHFRSFGTTPLVSPSDRKKLDGDNLQMERDAITPFDQNPCIKKKKKKNWRYK